VLGLSGTPISGKPAQFFAVLNMVRPDEFPSYWKFGFEFCAPTRNRWSGGWDFSGASHLDRLRRRLKGIMIRRKRKNVLKEIPLKQRVVTPVDITNRSEYVEAEKDFLNWLLRKKGRLARDKAARAKALVMMGELKRLAAAGKMRAVKQWVQDFLAETDEKLILFAVHRSAITSLRSLFPKALVIDGSVSAQARRGKDGRETSARQEIVDRFQKDPRARLLIGQLRAAGEGIDLIAASTVLFVELGWTPGAHDQAEDRVARMGQTAKKITAHYLVGKDTIEEHVLAIIQEKDRTVSRVLDGRRAAKMQLLTMFMRRAQKIARKRRLSA
jgi:SWI/SNF-related matrix-associated actin-dependent regulator 1 of chromatin subfamily A